MPMAWHLQLCIEYTGNKSKFNISRNLLGFQELGQLIYLGSSRPKLPVYGFWDGCTQLLRHWGRIPGVHYLHYPTTPRHTTSHDIIPHLIILSHDIVSHHIIPHFQHLTKMIDFWQLRLGQHCRPLKMSDDSLIAKKYIGSLSLVDSLASHVYDVLCHRVISWKNQTTSQEYTGQL